MSEVRICDLTDADQVSLLNMARPVNDVSVIKQWLAGIADDHGNGAAQAARKVLSNTWPTPNDKAPSRRA